ncbi:efflux RND transporter periplasmic adaptor subunit [Ochrobactrum sp. WV_118_8]|uniref:Efflux RND transporter periplasmic adaptor subunit n=1 Tax=Shinella sumterensis TaxID=1967501 RepID=A0AA50H7N8_9HYPH|nr:MULTISPECIES: efflux RND transporter periplasmic adaptor subunit [Rhizobiaceae]MCZ7455927.1 efflux RND transporter periplasmic adaptor subunit [Rhizobium rhizogenes]MDH0873089.1 efflux RND transporter periplasmic adaptor subunit [Agrobacterium pusense]MDH2090823.1 efflux RND transporter periplasmic adaptor subunit [Agrobacterium pusense]WLR97009.1 efflux RND transporter periplasmic adaptor subunit [Shinella sumterensis]
MRSTTSSGHADIAKSKVRILLSGITVALAVTLAGCKGEEKSTTGTGGSAFVSAAVASKDLGTSEVITGVVESKEPLQASAAQGGRIVQLNGNVGDAVDAGHILAMIDDTSAKLRIRQAEEELRRVEALSIDRAAAAQRISTLAAKGSASEAGRSAAVAEATATQAALDSARAAVSFAKNEADLFIVRASSAGRISTRTAEVGAVVAPGQVLFSIENESGRVIAATAPQALAAQLKSGQSARYTAGSTEGEAVILSVSPKVESGGVVRVRLEVKTGGVLPGAIVQVSIAGDVGDQTIKRVPATAINLDGGGSSYVYLIKDGGQIERTAVRLRGLEGADARISAPFPVGASVVAAGGAFLRDGQSVKIVTPGL